MSDLHDILTANLAAGDATSTSTKAYISHLTHLSLTTLTSDEAANLASTSAQLGRSLQSLAQKYHGPICQAAAALDQVPAQLRLLAQQAHALQEGVLPRLESRAAAFADKYAKSAEASNLVLAARKNTLLLARNADRITNILDLPTLLASAVSSGASTTTAAAAIPALSIAGTDYTAALDIHAHIQRLATLHPTSQLIRSLAANADNQLQALSSTLVTNLRAPGLKLATAMRTIGWMRRVAPDLADNGLMGALFLSCRLAALTSLLDALEPLRELAAAETADAPRRKANAPDYGLQTERYLKRYIDVFRQESFAIVSTYTSIFPTWSNRAAADEIPAPLTSFVAHIVDMLFATLQEYLPNVSNDAAARHGLLTQVLYCAGSLGRLGGDFSVMVGILEEDLAGMSEQANADEWVAVVKSHRLQASRLELMASGVGIGTKQK